MPAGRISGTHSTPSADAGATPVGMMIREWRSLRRLSQMELALDAGISPRHLSFVETGRSRASVDVLIRLADCLGLALRDRNRWLLAAGFAPRYGERQIDSEEMAPVRAALERLLHAHAPYPGVVLDRHWNVVLANTAAQQMSSWLPKSLREPHVNMFRASLHPQGYASRTENFDEWGRYLLDSLQRLAGSSRDTAIYALLEEVRSYENIAPLLHVGQSRAVTQTLLIPCILNVNGKRQSWFTTMTSFGTPRDVTLDELSIELFYPADDATRAQVQQALPE